MPPPSTQSESQHNEPTPRKRRRKRDDPQSCFTNSEEYESDDCSPMSCSDVESFQGKIVYNPDGSAYIIDSENESLSNIPENCMSAGTTTTTNNPKIHSFRVVTARDACVNISELNKIQKPILMCFICKLSFGNTKSFSLHANTEHTLNLQESEKLLLNREYSSAIIQRNVDEKPQISFLEPLDIQKQNQLNKLASPQTQQQHQQQHPQQQQLLISSTSSLSVNSNSNSNNNNNVSCSKLPTTLSPSSSSAIGSVSSVVAAAAAANAALVAAIAASCSNTSLNTSTSLSMNAPHIDSDLIMASLGGPSGGGGNSNPGYGNTTSTISNNPSSSSSSNCSQMIHQQQQRSDNFDNLNTLDLSAVTAAAQAAASTSIVNSRHTPPPSSPTSTTSSSPSSSSSSSASTLSLSAQQPSTTISASGLPAPTSTIATEPKSSHSLAMDTISSTFATSSPATKLSSSNSSSSVSNTLSNKNNSSAVLPPTPTTVADFLHQQFQHMQNQIRITSPASAIVVSASGSNTEMNALPSSVTTSAPSLSSLTASLAAAAAAVGSGSVTDLSSNSSGVKLINDFLQHQFQQQQQQQHQQQQPHSSFSTCPEHPDVKGIDCKTCEMIEINIKSPMTPTRSPNSINLFPSNLTLSPTAAAAPSFTIGACPEHINGRPLGVDCSRCEMILNSARLNSGVQMSTRNSCKTLKCPQCNWHYKYQETLEIHMREKHPDGESACGYCLAGQQHPRLARGESYTCGYKPYRCEICNYSTTTKGNLSIHMQSDKHLNNMQELNSSQNMANTPAEIRESPKIIMPNMQQQASKPKPSFRCDVCSYETSVARNLRIHMTSEKHTHNMAVLQNNIKHIQAFSFLQSQNIGQLSAAQSAAVAASNLPNIPNLQNFLPEAALADIAYNQALMIQLLHQNSAAGALSAAAAAAAAASPLTLPPPQQSPAGSGGTVSQPQTTPTSQQPPQQSFQSLQTSKLNHQSSPQQSMPTVATTGAPSLSSSSTTASSHPSSSQQHSAVAAAALLAEAAAAAAAAATSDPASICLQQQQQQQQQQIQQQDSSLDPPIDPDPKPTTAFSCLICANYNTNSIDELNNHLMIDRSRNTNNNCSDIMMIINNNYICRLCNYKTNLKANFQLHSKTDKHLQKLNYINHIREGGVKNEYKLKYNQTNTVQLKCNCCDFYTNSIQKLNMHTQHMRHDTMKMIFNHLLYLVNSFNVSMGGDSMAVVSENSEYQLMSKNKVLMCKLCNYSAVNILQIVQHVKSLRHIQVEQFICLQRRSENLESLGLDDVFKIADNTDCIKSERSSPVPSLESHQLLVKEENEKSSPMATTTTTTTTTALAVTPPATTTTAKSSHDIYIDSSSDHQQNVSSSSAIAVSNIANCNKELADVDLSSLPSIIYKCNNCDYFAQNKSEMQNHIVNTHQNVSEEDFLTIPTNPAALHAFHAAVAAAAVAVAENAAASQSRSKSSSPVHMHMQDDRQQQQHHDQGFATSVRGNELMPQVKTEQMDIMDDAQSNDECEQLEDPIELLSSRNSANVTSSPAVKSVMCPLCQDTFSEKKALEMHLMGVHSVNSDGLARLLQLVDSSHWLNSSRRSSTSTTPEPRNSSTPLSEAGGQLAFQQPQQQQQKQQQPGSSPVNQHVFSDEYACAQCGITFKLQQHLLMHANDAQHYQMVNEQYQCLAKHCQQLFGNLLQMLTHYKDSHMNIVISERHVYKYRCKQCSLAFKTQEKLNTHSLYHTMRDATKCMICNRNFRSTQSLQKHMEQAHSQLQPTSPIPSPSSSGEIANAPGSLSVTPSSRAEDEEVTANAAVTTSMTTGATTGTNNKFSNNQYNVDGVGDGQDIVSLKSSIYDSISVSVSAPPPPPPPPLPPPLPPPPTVLDILPSDKSQLEDYLNSQQMSEVYYTDVERKLKCHKCKVAYTNQSYLSKHYKSNQHRRNEKLSIYPLEKFLDPNRPFKCEVCRESFTQKNILLVHFNSVSHLHKAKKQQAGGSASPAKSIPMFSDAIEGLSESKGQTVEIAGGSGSGSNACGGDGGITAVNKSPFSKRKVSLESDYESPKKRFKCEICKVAYAQGSTLDIHMRSVLHQTRSCRLQEQQAQPLKPMTPPSSSESPTSTTATTPTLNDHMYKSLLETFGFDIVKQFNEINKLCTVSNSRNYYCRHCNKEFSSIFVLKTHCEEIHSEQIPLELLEKFAEKFKHIYLDQEPTSPTSLLTITNSDQNPNQCFSFNESENNLGATTSTACSDSNSPSPVGGEPAAGSNETSLIVPSTSTIAAPTSPNTSAVTAVAAALLKQQQHQQQQSLTPDLVQKLNLDPTMLAQKIMEQNFSNFPPNFPGLPQNLQSLQSLQSLQNLQNMQQNLPNMGNMPMNTLDMLNLMQFHHLMSLNFMNLAPPLIFGAGGTGPSPSVTGTTSATPSDLPPTAATQIIQQQTSSSSQNTSNQKRARTRITDDQLKILRAHFDINNSPSEESIMEMSKKANLPMKVVKHWFRNTLFKERQRNKDSPYNFNNPPSTTLNLEEYERTGQTKVTPLSESGGGSISGFHLQQQQQQREQQQREQQQREHQQQQIQQQQQLQQQIQSQHLQQQQQQRPPSSQSSDLNFPQLSFHQQQHDLSRQQLHQQQDNRPLSHPSSVTSDRGDIHIKPEPADDIGSSDCDQQMAMSKDHDNEQSIMQSHHQQSMFYNNFETKSESGSSEILSRPQTPNSTSTPYSSNISDILGQQMDSLPLNNMANISNLNNMGPPKKFQMNKMFEKSGNFETNSNSSNSSTSSGKRANRTRFTDYQIKVLQEFFENNSYPKDSDLEYLSKLLLLSPRVIVVWFQNARQKQRKIYENQPNNTFYESEEKKPNINYACKKCNLVFQRYYELIRHQKNHCFKEENNKKSAKAQIAAAQIAQSLSSEDSNSSIDINSTNMLSSNLVGPQAAAAAAAVAVAAAAVGGNVGTAIPPVMPGLASSPGINLLASPQHIFKQQQAVTSVGGSHADSTSPLQKFECDKCQLVFNRYELYKEHQLIHLMNPNLFMNQNYNESSPFGILQNLQGNHNSQQDTSIDLSRQKKRKYSDTQNSPDELHHQQTDYEAFNKKFKNDQYEFLYQYFLQNDSNSDLKKQFQQQQQQPEMDLDYLANFYQQNEYKKLSNYDFLLQYYMRNESKQPSNASNLMLLNDDANKPNMDFLLQYYQLSESKKFFQLEASPQRIHDFPPLLNLTSNAAAAAVAAINNGVSAQQHQEQQQVSVISPTETPMNTTTNTNVAISSPNSSPVRQQSNNSGCAIGNKDTTSNNKNCQTHPTVLTENVKLLSATVSAFGGGSGNGSGVPTATLPITTPNTTNTGSTSFSTNSINNNRHCPILSPLQTKQQENSSLISNRLDAAPAAAAAATASEFAVQSIKLSVNNISTNAVSKTSPIANSIDMMDAELGITHHHQQHDSSATSVSSASHQLEETVTTTEKQNSKRLRTTILPEQLNFLYECYQNESNPSRKMLEEISKKVNLKKRVVQVWYQNSRARERKGQFRQNIQIINKKCPHCAAIFKIKSALEWHLQSKHGDKQAINVDQIPDLKFSDGLLNFSSSTPYGIKVDEQHKEQQKLKEQPSSPTTTPTTTTPPPATLSPVKSALCVASVVTTNAAAAASSPAVSSAVSSVASSASILTLAKGGGTTPLDLSKTPTPLVNNFSKYEQSESDISFSDSNNDHDESNDFFTPSSSLNNGNLGNLVPNNRANNCINNRRQYDTNLIDGNNVAGGCSYNDNNTMSNISDYLGNERENTNSPVSQTSSNNSAQQKKRFRTQMSNLQVRILKTLFHDVKTPSMTDCSNVGREIGLGKRVIQVWFQNARAKEKKSRNQRYIHDENTFENDKPNVDSTTSNNILEIRECNICQLPSVNIQEHAFSAQHIAQVRVLLEANSSNKSDDNQQYVENSMEHEFNGIYSKLYTQQQHHNNHSHHHKNENADSGRADTSHHDKDDSDVDYHCPNIMTNVDCVNNDKNYENDDDDDDEHDDDDHDHDADDHDDDAKTKLGIQNEDMALSEANKAALALRNFNKLQQHFAAATAFAKQQHQYPHQQQLQQQQQCDTISSASPPTMENNLMLKINTDNPLATNHSEMLQQLFSYSQMSVIGGK